MNIHNYPKITPQITNTCGQVRKDTEGHRGARVGAEWCRGVVRCECDTETGQWGHKGHGGTYFRVHYTEGKREKTQMGTDGHRFMMTHILVMLGGSMDADRCVGMEGMQKTARWDTEGHSRACSRCHAHMPNRNEKNRTTKLPSKICKTSKNDKPKTSKAQKLLLPPANKRRDVGVRGNRERTQEFVRARIVHKFAINAEQ